MAAFLRFSALWVCLIKGKRNLSFDIYPAYNTNHLFLIAVMLAFWAIAGGQVLQTANAGEQADIATFATPDDKQEYVPDEVLVILANDANTDNKEVGAMVGGIVKKRMSFVSSRRTKLLTGPSKTIKNQVLRVKLSEGKSVKQAIAEHKAKKDPRIVRVEPNYRVRALGVPNDTYFTRLWAMRNTGQTGGIANADIDAVSAWDITTGSDDVVVAVIDTGIDYRHPDIAANIWTNPDEIAGNGRDDDHNGYIDDVHGYNFVDGDGNVIDKNGHGTHCSGTIAGSGNNDVGVTGVNWRCKLMACRFLDETGSGSVADAIEAINYAVANGANILSNSWGGGEYSAALAAAITNAKNNGVLFVAAAGNDSADCDSSAHYPSGYNISNVIAVAATDCNDELAWFSNYGRNSVHLGAPGVSILSTVLGNGYAYYSGTSMATPHVAGVAALLLAYNPSMSLSELKTRLIWTGDLVDSLADKTITGRRLNAYNALTASPSLTVIAPNTSKTLVQGFDWTITWASIGGSNTVDIYLLKAGAEYLQLASGVSNTGEFSWNIPSTVPVGSDYRIWISDGVNTDESDANFAISDTRTDYFTQLFSSASNKFDLSNKSLLLTPDESSSRYLACLKEITEFPVNPAVSTNLTVDDDGSQAVTLTGHSVKIYGESYNTFYVNANGHITFDAADTDYIESLSNHFAAKRISALFRDLDPSSAGLVRYKELDDRAVVTWQGVPEYGVNNSNTFQVEMFYDGRIRLSWLSVDSQAGLVGISEGTGAPTDFLESDVSDYQPCEMIVESVEVAGPDNLAEGAAAQFTCIAHYDDGSTKNLTTGQATWTVDSNYATIDANGLITAADVNGYQQCTVTATFNGKSNSRKLVITDSTIHNFTIKKCGIKAGKIRGLDSISCSGDFNATAELIAAAGNITVRIYSQADDYLVYEQAISTGLFVNSKNAYTYKYKTTSGRPGGITLLKFDVSKNKFDLKAANVNLTGLACPLYVLIDIGAYSGMGIAGENVVNGRQKIPVRLLSGYADTLSIAKYCLKITSKPAGSSLSVKGALTVADDSSVTAGLTITWGEQTFTIPGNRFTQVKADRWKGKYFAPDGSVINADFDFAKCDFTVKIKQTQIESQWGTVDFNLAFGNYTKTAEVRQ
ncbi:MAG: S8 family serine peptidase [Sedimentisphaerales bacterium]|jgi:subtilisin family serine protease